jgi:hypothetical protein
MKSPSHYKTRDGHMEMMPSDIILDKVGSYTLIASLEGVTIEEIRYHR